MLTKHWQLLVVVVCIASKIQWISYLRIESIHWQNYKERALTLIFGHCLWAIVKRSAKKNIKSYLHTTPHSIRCRQWNNVLLYILFFFYCSFIYAFEYMYVRLCVFMYMLPSTHSAWTMQGNDEKEREKQNEKKHDEITIILCAISKAPNNVSVGVFSIRIDDYMAIHANGWCSLYLQLFFLFFWLNVSTRQWHFFLFFSTQIKRLKTKQRTKRYKQKNKNTNNKI